MSGLLYSEEWGDALQRDHDEYMDALFGSLETEEGMADITGEPFCGCFDCERRASWTFLLLRAVQAYRDGSLRLEG